MIARTLASAPATIFDRSKSSAAINRLFAVCWTDFAQTRHTPKSSFKMFGTERLRLYLSRVKRVNWSYQKRFTFSIASSSSGHFRNVQTQTVNGCFLWRIIRAIHKHSSVSVETKCHGTLLESRHWKKKNARSERLFRTDGESLSIPITIQRTRPAR